MTMPAPTREARDTVRAPVRLVDADVHTMPRSWDELMEYVPAEHRGADWLNRVTIAPPVYQPLNDPGPKSFRGARMDSVPEEGGGPGSSPALLERQVFEAGNVDMAILLPLMVSGMADPWQESLLRSAMNSWLEDTWLTRYNAADRYRGSVHLVPARADLAAAEIDKWAGHPMFVQGLIDPYLAGPLGQHRYRPMLEAAARHNLPIALHLNRTPGVACLSPVGFASFYAEFHPNFAMAYIPHLVSLIFEGVFDALPDLRVVFVECGSTWVAPLLWRMDRYWHEYRSDVPHVKRPPSEYLAEHFRFTTQPIEEPHRPSDLRELLEWLDVDRLMMFSSDYPHWDFDNPLAVAKALPPRSRDAILAGNAIDFYGLPSERVA